MTAARASLAFFLVTAVIAAALYFQRPSHDGIWRFNFAPDTAPEIDAFINIDAAADYSGWRAYGWLDAAGPVETGRWPGDRDTSWESRDNLNVILRRSPDTLAQGFATGSAIFALDLEPGIYEVWVLSGDAGHLEYSPHEPYRILVENEPITVFEPGTENYMDRFETPPDRDQLSHDDIWEQSIAPAFKWSRAIVDVSDGQLNVKVDGQPRELNLTPFMGDYAHTEVRSGPAVRYSGALNALVVLPYEAGSSRGTQAIELIDAGRRTFVRENWPQFEVEPSTVVGLGSIDTARGYTAYPVNVLSHVMPGDTRAHTETSLMLRATPGEYVPITFAISPLKDLGNTHVEFSLSRKSDPAARVPVADNLTYGVVRYLPSRVKKRSGYWQADPAYVAPGNRWDIKAGVTKQFWLTYRIPDEMSPGLYEGSISIQPTHGQASQFGVQLEVLPFRLQRPTQIAIGMTYFSPVQYAAIDESAFWSRMQAEFADMRAHNLTTVQYTGIHMDDYVRMGRALNLYRNAGFEQPIDLLESYGAMTRMRREGIAWESSTFQTAYVRFIQDFLTQAEQRNWPPVIINFGDEFTNRGIEAFGAEVARNLKKIPGIVTAADVNGYRELTLLAPEVDIIAFNDGWDGPRRVNSGRRLLNRETVEEVLEAGAIPWLVNIGIDRFSNGYWLWKMVRLGVRGKIEWIYRGYNGMPYNSFDAVPLRTHAVYPGPKGAAIPSLGYERMRIGLDDLAYLYTLERVIDASHDDPENADAVRAATTFIEGLDARLDEDISVYSKSGSGNRWPPERYDALRDEVIEWILALSRPEVTQ